MKTETDGLEADVREAEMKVAQENVERRLVKAPLDGIVDRGQRSTPASGCRPATPCCGSCRSTGCGSRACSAPVSTSQSELLEAAR